jgi:hypothetical protein
MFASSQSRAKVQLIKYAETTIAHYTFPWCLLVYLFVCWGREHHWLLTAQSIIEFHAKFYNKQSLSISIKMHKTRFHYARKSRKIVQWKSIILPTVCALFERNGKENFSIPLLPVTIGNNAQKTQNLIFFIIFFFLNKFPLKER